MRKETIDISEWFDINNLDHLRAYKHLEEHGVWPEGFIPENVVFTRATWHYGLVNKMAEGYVAIMLEKK